MREFQSDYLFQASLGFKRCCYHYRHSTVHVVCTVKYKEMQAYTVICPKMSFFKRNEEPQTRQSSSVGWSETWKHENVEKTQAKQMTRRQNYGFAYCINHPESVHASPDPSLQAAWAPDLKVPPPAAAGHLRRARIHTKLSLKDCQPQSIKHSLLKEKNA